MTDLSRPLLIRYVRRTNEGMQRPPVFEADDGREYVLKLDTADPDFPAAELVAAGLAAAFEVPLPDYRVLRAPEELVGAMLDTPDPDLVEFAESFRRREGTCFGSCYLPGVVVKWDARLRRRVKDADKVLACVLVFDAFIENVDRTSATNPNLLVSNGALFAIDHGQALPSVQGLNGKSLPYPFDSHLGWQIILQHPSLLERPVGLLRALDLRKVDAAIAAVPSCWWSSPDRPERVRVALERRRDELLVTLGQLKERL